MTEDAFVTVTVVLAAIIAIPMALIWYISDGSMYKLIFCSVAWISFLLLAILVRA